MNTEKNKKDYRWLSFIVFVILIAAWCIASYSGMVSKIFLPSPSDVVSEIVKGAEDGSLWENCWISIGGTNHALPTGGSARFASPLSVDDFIKKSTFSYFTKEGLDGLKDEIAVLARSEGFEGHARSALSRHK